MNKLNNFWEFFKTLSISMRIASIISVSLVLLGYLTLCIASGGIIFIVSLAIAALVCTVITFLILGDKYEDYRREQRYRENSRNW